MMRQKIVEELYKPIKLKKCEHKISFCYKWAIETFQ